MDLVNLREECGDLFWYMALLCDHYDYNFREAYRNNVEYIENQTVGNPNRLLLRFVRMVHVSNAMLEAYIVRREDPNIDELFSSIGYIMIELGANPDDVAERNIEKLRTRIALRGVMLNGMFGIRL